MFIRGNRAFGRKPIIFAAIISVTTFIYGTGSFVYTVNPTFASKLNAILGTFGKVEATSINTSVNLVSPSNGKTYTVMPANKQKVNFVTSVNTALPTQTAVFYQKEGDTKWTNFGTKPNIDMYGHVTQPNYKTMSNMDYDGWLCQSNYRINSLATCRTATGYTSPRTTLTIADKLNSKLYLPGVDLAPGNYKWLAKVKITGSNYPGWTEMKTFTINEYNQVYTKVSTTKKMVAITFDDGPTSANTAEFCKILNTYKAKATFFFVGSRLAALPGEAAIANSCGEIGNHTLSHYEFNYTTTVDQAYKEIEGAEQIFAKYSERTKWFRPRGGIFNSNVLAGMKKTNEVLINWNVKAGDYGPENPNRDTIVSRVLNSTELTPGSIILLHQTYGPTKEALPFIFDGLTKKGYTVTTVSELMANSN
jgi:peptidoglycan/xylan/chitin deacetylase (PgdA/CDA1 family)